MLTMTTKNDGRGESQSGCCDCLKCSRSVDVWYFQLMVDFIVAAQPTALYSDAGGR